MYGLSYIIDFDGIQTKEVAQMKKGILTILVAVFALFLLTGCSVAGHTHAWILQEKIEATCEKDGASIFVCECGKKLARESSAVGHDWEEWERTETYILYACLHCATKKSRNDPATCGFLRG